MTTLPINDRSGTQVLVPTVTDAAGGETPVSSSDSALRGYRFSAQDVAVGADATILLYVKGAAANVARIRKIELSCASPGAATPVSFQICRATAIDETGAVLVVCPSAKLDHDSGNATTTVKHFTTKPDNPPTLTPTQDTSGVGALASGFMFATDGTTPMNISPYVFSFDQKTCRLTSATDYIVVLVGADDTSALVVNYTIDLVEDA